MDLSLYFPLLCAVNSIILLTNGISFAIQAILLLVIGAWADYGTWRYAPSKGYGQTLTVRQQAEHLNCLHDSVGWRLVCLARRSTPIPMARGHRFIYPRL